MSASNDNIDPKGLLLLLESGVKEHRCGEYLYHLDALYRQQIYQNLEIERLQRKYLQIREIYQFSGQDWNQTFLVYFLRYLSDEANRKNFMEIGFRIGFKAILRERTSLRNLEALFIAASGLIDTLPRDSFTDKLRKDVEYMIHKYQINPISKEEWVRRRMMPAKEPILRLVQVARLFHENDLIFNKLISCRMREDIFNLFNVPALSEWSRYYGETRVRRIGVEKCDLIGINFVVPMLFAYGHYTLSDELVSAANELNEMLPAESNRYITKWRGCGLTPTSAYETQALIQLSTEYCKKLACARCHIYRHMLSKGSILGNMPSFMER